MLDLPEAMSQRPPLAATAEVVGARMRAYKRLADLHREDYQRLYAEERGE